MHRSVQCCYCALEVDQWGRCGSCSTTMLDLSAYDARCHGCGAIFHSRPPEHCDLCGSDVFEPIEDLAF